MTEAKCIFFHSYTSLLLSSSNYISREIVFFSFKSSALMTDMKCIWSHVAEYPRDSLEFTWYEHYMIAKQSRWLFAPALLLSHPHKSEGVNDDIKWKKANASTSVSQYSPICILMPKLPYSIISPVMNAIKTGFSILQIVLACQALHLPHKNTFALFFGW